MRTAVEIKLCNFLFPAPLEVGVATAFCCYISVNAHVYGIEIKTELLRQLLLHISKLSWLICAGQSQAHRLPEKLCM